MIDLNTRRFDKVYDANGINVLHGLYDLIKENIQPNYTICEIGSFRGVSSSLFAEFCKTVYCIDPWVPYSNNIDVVNQGMIDDAEREFNERSENYTNIIKIKSSSLEACKTFDDNYFDLVYVDGSHSYNDVKNDIVNWLPKIKQSGFISGHDFYHESIKRAIFETIGLEDIKTYSDSSWLKRTNI